MLKSNHSTAFLQTTVWGFILYLVSVVFKTTDTELMAFAVGVPTAMCFLAPIVLKELRDTKLMLVYIPALIAGAGVYWVVGEVISYLTGSTLTGFILAIPVIYYTSQIPGRIWLWRHHPEILRSLC